MSEFSRIGHALRPAGLALALLLGLWAATLSGVAQAQAPDAATDGPPPLPPTVTTQAPPPLPTYYIAERGQQVGPLDLGELQTRVDAGSLTPTTLVWTTGMADWQPAREISALDTLFAAAGPAPEPEPEPVTPALVPADFIVGSWHTSGPIPVEGLGMAPADLTTVYAADGSVRITGTVTAAIPGLPTPTTTITLTSEGTWSVEPIDNGRFALTSTLTTRGSAPGLDLSDLEDTATDTETVEIVDPDTVRDGGGVIWTRVPG